MEHNKQTPIFPILDVHTLLVNKKKQLALSVSQNKDK